MNAHRLKVLDSCEGRYALGILNGRGDDPVFSGFIVGDEPDTIDRFLAEADNAIAQLDVAALRKAIGAVLRASKARGQQNSSEQPTATPVTVALSAVEPQRIRWLWPARIPSGKLTLLAGDAGLGKSLLTLYLAACQSRSIVLPGMESAEAPGATLLLNVEDDLADTIRPRLDALGADCSRVFALTGIREAKGERLPRLDRDLALLEAEIGRTGARLVIVDPINAYIGTIDNHRDNELRSVLTPLAVLAQRTGAAVVAVTHLNKAADATPAHRVMGSLAYVAAARSVLAVGRDPDNADRRVLVQIKSNLAAMAPGLGFTITDGALTFDDDPVSEDTIAIFGPPGTGRPAAAGSALAEAQDFLRVVLKDDRQLVEAVTAEAAQVGISIATLRRAREALGVRATKTGFGEGGKWFWYLAGDARLDAEPDEGEAF